MSLVSGQYFKIRLCPTDRDPIKGVGPTSPCSDSARDSGDVTSPAAGHAALAISAKSSPVGPTASIYLFSFPLGLGFFGVLE